MQASLKTYFALEHAYSIRVLVKFVSFRSDCQSLPVLVWTEDMNNVFPMTHDL